MKELQILVGNIGAGKTTYCKQKTREGYVIISKDDIRYSIGAGTYTFNFDYEPAINLIILMMVIDFMAIGVPVIIDETNMNKASRYYYLQFANIYKYKKIAVIFKKLSMKESVARRLNKNHGETTEEVWKEVWERFNFIYEAPTKEEGFDIIENYSKEIDDCRTK